MRLEKGDREGQWFARFPRNCQLAISFEPHVLIWGGEGAVVTLKRPCLNLWATVE